MGDGMTGAADWLQVRRDYEAGIMPVTEIAAAAGINANKLTAKARREGWTLRGRARVKTQGTRETIARLKALLQRRLAELESQLGTLGGDASAATSEREIRSMNTLVRTLEKVLELERKDRAGRTRRRHEHKQFDDAERDALARRLEALHDKWSREEAQSGTAGEPDPRLEPGLAELGQAEPASA